MKPLAAALRLQGHDRADAPATRARRAGHRGPWLTCPHLSLTPQLPRPRAGRHPAQVSRSPVRLLLLLPGGPRLLPSSPGHAGLCTSLLCTLRPGRSSSGFPLPRLSSLPPQIMWAGTPSKDFLVAGDQDLIPGLGSSSGEGNCNPLQYSCLVIPWTEKPSRLQSMGSQRVGHD